MRERVHLLLVMRKQSASVPVADDFSWNYNFLGFKYRVIEIFVAYRLLPCSKNQVRLHSGSINSKPANNRPPNPSGNATKRNFYRSPQNNLRRTLIGPSMGKILYRALSATFALRSKTANIQISTNERISGDCFTLQRSTEFDNTTEI